jgi:2-keto-myo-inositol isomerase
MIKYGLNGSTTMPLDQATEIRQVAAAGFDLIEFRAPKIEQFLQTGALAELKQLLDDTGLEPLSINSIEKLQSRPAAELLVECEQHAAWAQGLGCPYIIAVPGFLSEPVPPQEAIARTVDALAPLAEIAGAHNLHLGFEFLGFADCWVNSLAMARDIVRKLASPHTGLVIDTFHFYLSGEPMEMLSDLQPGELLLFHVNDVENLPRAELADEHRILPGDGVIPLKEMWTQLRERDLITHASLELFHPGYWQQQPEAFLPPALASMKRIFQ